MCGIAGIYTYSKQTPPVNTDELIRIRDHMTKRAGWQRHMGIR